MQVCPELCLILLDIRGAPEQPYNHMTGMTCKIADFTNMSMAWS